MLTIRTKQIEAFRNQSSANFTDLMVEHLREVFPEDCQEMSEEELRDVIRYGTAVADSYGINNVQSVCTYIDLMFIFGYDFDEDPNFPWARAVLLDESLDQDEAMDLLLQYAIMEDEDGFESR